MVVEREFGVLVQTLTEIFARIDPLALVERGAPRDEDRPEVETILLGMTTRTVTALTRLIARECNTWFGGDPHGSFPRDRELARALVRALHERPSPLRVRPRADVDAPREINREPTNRAAHSFVTSQRPPSEAPESGRLRSRR